MEALQDFVQIFRNVRGENSEMDGLAEIDDSGFDMAVICLGLNNLSEGGMVYLTSWNSIKQDRQFLVKFLKVYRTSKWGHFDEIY